MKDVNIVVVDDSPFFVAMLTQLLKERGIHVIGSAHSKEDAVDVVAKLNPDIVTMDMVMPQTDGIECTKAIHAVNPKTSVILISALLDDEMIRKARKTRVSGFIHKPVDVTELTYLINQVAADNELFSEMDNFYFTAFREAFTCISYQFFKTAPKYLDKDNTDILHESRGISMILGITGKYKGRIFLDQSCETARRITSVYLKKETHSKEEVIYVLNKIATAFSEIVCTKMNNKNELWEIHAVPPVIFYGESIMIAKSNLDTVNSEIAETVFGDIYMNVGFAKDSTL